MKLAECWVEHLKTIKLIWNEIRRLKREGKTDDQIKQILQKGGVNKEAIDKALSIASIDDIDAYLQSVCT